MAKKVYIDFEKVVDLLGGEDKYLNDFWEAGAASFTQFRDEYRQYLIGRDLENLRKAGHRIKPVAQMLSVEEINKEYEKAKRLINNEASDEELEKSVNKIDAMCNQIVKEFNEKLQTLAG